MVASLIARSGGIIPPDSAALVDHAPALRENGHLSYARQLICQVWGFDGELKSGSDGAPREQLAHGGSGFSDSDVDGETWRVYSHVDQDHGIRVIVGGFLDRPQPAGDWHDARSHSAGHTDPASARGAHLAFAAPWVAAARSTGTGLAETDGFGSERSS